MSDKKVPFTKDFVKATANKYPTPFHVYDEKAIRENAKAFYSKFGWVPSAASPKGGAFKNFFAVKALPNPYVMKVLQSEGLGFDCSSLAELELCERIGAKGEEVFFTSNDTKAEEFVKAKSMGVIINLDDITHLDYLAKHADMPEMICFRYNPGPLREGNALIGKPEEAKYGLTREQVLAAYPKAKAMGAKRFALHTMVASNELNASYFVETARMLFDLALELHQKTGIAVELVNFGGGIGIPYRLEQQAVDLDFVSKGIKELYDRLIAPSALQGLRIVTENGRVITGPYGYLVTQAIHEKHIYKEYVGVDGCMANLMRPGMYGAYHHITVLGKEGSPRDKVYDVVGSLCENNDKFAVDRQLPAIEPGDYLVIHDTGAHGHAMGFNYNGKLRSAEIMLRPDGSAQLIRRAETVDDLFATLDFTGLRG
jgi:diaminopimelate decarboxylase